MNLYIPNSIDFGEMTILIKENLSKLTIKRQNFTEQDKEVKALKKYIRDLNYAMFINAKDYLKQKIAIIKID